MTGAPLHLIVGPERHGVTRHAQRIADACGHPSLLMDRVDDAALAGLDLGGVSVVHVPFTDRLFATSAERSLVAFERLAAAIHARGANVSVTLHDLPKGDAPLQVRRRIAYSAVVALCRGVVVSSWHELAALESVDATHLHSLQVIPLPVDRAPGAGPRPTGNDVVVVGFVYPDRGYETVLEALPAGSGLIAVGQASAGHADLPVSLAGRAAQLGRAWTCTGYVADDALARWLREAAVPIAPNPRPSASASIGDWLAHGRRPLVADSPLTREIDAAWPGAVVRYDPTDTAGLRELIADRLAEPELTVLAAQIAIGPSLAETAALYRRHLAGCAPPTAIAIGGRSLVPGNRWDLAAAPPTAGRETTVSVVIPYFREQRRLDLVLDALARQTYPAHRIEIIVADDGSPVPPDGSAAGNVAIQVVRQPDRGFRAAAARNLGADAASGDVLAFLDADTIPEPTYLDRLLALPSSAHDIVTVGRRRHADLAGWSPTQVRHWLAGSGPVPAELVEPRWLVDAYERSGNLLTIDSRSYRYVISAVMALDRELFDAAGRFDERFVSYGGEDWELASRLLNAGAVLAHARDAVAWHDGPEWAGRDIPDRRRAKNAETALLAQLVPDPMARGRGLWAQYPEVVVTLPAADLPSTLATVRSGLVSGADCGFWILGDTGTELAAQLSDPRVRSGRPPVEVTARARIQVALSRPGDLRRLEQVCEQARRVGIVETPVGTVVASSGAARAERWGAALGTAPEDLLVQLFGGSASGLISPWSPDLDLAQVLASL